MQRQRRLYLAAGKAGLVKIAVFIALALTIAAMSIDPVQAQACIAGPCAADNRHDLFVERQYRDFLLQRYPNYGSRYRGMSPDISVGPGATVGGPLPGTVGRIRVRPQQRIKDATEAHLRWCRERYISYRAYDNTFQPFDGPRRPCHSPYN